MWFYAEGRERKGPVERAVLDELASTGRIEPDTLVWTQGMNQWQQASVAIPDMVFMPKTVQAEPPAAGPPPARPPAAGPPPAAAPPPVQVAPQSSAPMPAAPPPPTPVAPPPPVAGQAPPAADYAPPVAGQAPPVASSYPQATYQPPSQVGYPAGQALHQAPVDAAPIPNYLPWAILATLLCCMPAGVVGIIYASKANALKTAGNYVEARHKADIARNWLLASVGVALMAFVLVFFANLADGAVPM